MADNQAIGHSAVFVDNHNIAESGVPRHVHELLRAGATPIDPRCRWKAQFELLYESRQFVGGIPRCGHQDSRILDSGQGVLVVEEFGLLPNVFSVDIIGLDLVVEPIKLVLNG